MEAVVHTFLLAVPEWWDTISPEHMALMTNGMGLEWWPDSVRGFLDRRTGFLPAADVHDVEWFEAARLYGLNQINYAGYCLRINLSNERFHYNCKQIISQQNIHWYNNPLQWIRKRAHARACYRAVEIGGGLVKAKAKLIHR